MYRIFDIKSRIDSLHLQTTEQFIAFPYIRITKAYTSAVAKKKKKGNPEPEPNIVTITKIFQSNSLMINHKHNLPC